MEIKEAIIKSIGEVFPLYQMNPLFLQEEQNDVLYSADQVNVLNSFSYTLKGNIIFGFNKIRALQIASSMKGYDPQEIDLEAKETIGEIITLTVNLAISKFKAVNDIYISPPVVILGDNLFLMISRSETTRLIFKIDEDILTVSFSIEGA